MSVLSDVIEEFIKSLIEEEQQEDRELVLQRNELAKQFNCAPSQINYVLSTRFTLENGYTTYSKRGGGGYIRIVRVPYSQAGICEQILEFLQAQESLSQSKANMLLDTLFEHDMLTKRESKLLKAAVSDKALNVPPSTRNMLRGNMLRALLGVLWEQKQGE